MRHSLTIRVFILSLIVGATGLGVALVAAYSPGPVSAPAVALQRVDKDQNLRIIESGERGLVLELVTPGFELTQAQMDGGECDLLTVPGYGETAQAGWPRLPIRGAMIGIPPQAEPKVTVLAAEAELEPGRYNLCPAPQPIVETEQPTGTARYGGMAAAQDQAAYAADNFYPASPVELVSTGFIRSQRVGQLRFHPLQYNPVSGELRLYKRIRVQIDFGPAEDKTGQPVDDQQAEEGEFEGALERVLVNYASARDWRTSPAPLARADAISGTAQFYYKISINQDGLYQLTYNYLWAAGINPAAFDPRTLQLFNQGQEVALWVQGEQDGVFDANDVILFYGQGLNNKNTNTNVYWLTWGITNGLRMATVDGTPSGAPAPADFGATQRMETDRWYQSSYPSGLSNDHWYWDLVIATGIPVSRSYTTTLQNLAAAPYSVTVRGLLRGYSAIPEHHTKIFLNGHLLEEQVWLPQTEYDLEVAAPSSYLNEGTNTISVMAGISVTRDYVWVNWFELDYRARHIAGNDLLWFNGDQPGTWKYAVGGWTTASVDILDITWPLAPARILSATLQPGGGTYTATFQQAILAERHYLALSTAQRLVPANIERDVAADLSSTANGADYIIITHAKFYTAVQPLAAFHAAQGLRVKIVDVQEAYDEFGYGVFDPEAIRSFLSYAYAAWARPAPAYVLLVGDGNYDPKSIYNRGEPSYIPPYLADVDPWLGETAADNRYVCVSGSDILPDMHLGRLPVKTVEQAVGLVDKILNYTQNPPPGDWNAKLLFVADNADTAGDFAALSDVLVNGYVPGPFQPQKVYLGITHSSGAIARTAIISAINEGRLVVNYIGHGATTAWASEKMLRTADIAALANGGRQPLALPMTCLEGYFITPSPSTADYSSLGEAIVRAAGKGAVASWSPTGLGVALGHDYMNRDIFDAFFYDGVNQLGPATTRAKLYLYASTGGYRELLDTYLLFGDPALRLNVLKTDVSLAQSVDPAGSLRPGDKITYTLTFSNPGPATAFHVVIDDVLPAGLTEALTSSFGAAVTLRSGSRLVWDVADLAAGQGGSITIAARISPTFTGVLTNEVSIATTAIESDTTNNRPEPLVTHLLVPELSIEKLGPTALPSGAAITYTLYYSNTGDAPADHVVITDGLPSELMTVEFAFSGAVITPQLGADFVWDVADLAPGQGGVITVSGTITPWFAGIITNGAAIASARPERNMANNVAEPVVTGVDVPDLVIHKQGPAELVIGSPITFVLSFENIGLATAPQGVITDLLPLALTNVHSLTVGAVITPRVGSPFVWDVADLAPGEGGVITITATLSPTFVGFISNTAYIHTPALERLGNNVSHSIVTQVGLPDLAISKYGPAEVVSGSRITFTLFYSNLGSLRAGGVVISDALPAGLSGVSFAYSGAAVTVRPGSAIAWDVADLAVGQGGVITVSAIVSQAFAGILTNTAFITTTTLETNAANNSAVVTTDAGMPDLVIYKRGPAGASAGDRISYTLVYSNAGSLAARGVVISDVLPAALLTPTVFYASAEITPRLATRFVWDAPDLAVGQGGVITISALVNPAFVGVLTNTASIAAAQETNGLNNTTEAIRTEVGRPDLSIRKYGPIDAVAGRLVTYTLVYSNAGSFEARAVVISDMLPAALLSPTVSCSGAAVAPRPGASFVWDVSDLAVGAGGTITITAWLDHSQWGSLTNTVSIAAGNSELVQANNVDAWVSRVWHRLYLPLIGK